MKMSNLKKRLQKDRLMTSISIRIPKDVLDDLKFVAPKIGFSGYQPLIKAYIGQGLRTDLEKLESSPDIVKLLESLKRKGVQEKLIQEALAEST